MGLFYLFTVTNTKTKAMGTHLGRSDISATGISVMKLCGVNNNKNETFIIATFFVKYKILSVRPTRFVLTPRFDDDHLTHCGRVRQICVFNMVKLGTSASSPYCHSTRRNVSRDIKPSSTTRVFGEYFLKISVHKNS